MAHLAQIQPKWETIPSFCILFLASIRLLLFLVTKCTALLRSALYVTLLLLFWWLFASFNLAQHSLSLNSNHYHITYTSSDWCQVVYRKKTFHATRTFVFCNLRRTMFVGTLHQFPYLLDWIIFNALTQFWLRIRFWFSPTHQFSFFLSVIWGSSSYISRMYQVNWHDTFYSP